MSMQAFRGDNTVKSSMIEAIRPRWVAKELAPVGGLRWDPENGFNSLCGALVQSQDGAAFEEKAGIPLELGMLCEMVVLFGLDLVAPDETSPLGFSMNGSPEIFAFGLEWLEAIRPGADLSNVIPQYLVKFLAAIMSDEFALAAHIEPQIREAARRIQALWAREISGEKVDSKTWREVRKFAVAASEANSEPWGLTVAHFVETIAWPLRGIGAEFVGVFAPVFLTWLDCLQRPFLSEQDQESQQHGKIGWLKMMQASRNGDLDDAASDALLDSMPESKRAMMSITDPDVKSRTRSAKIKARVVTDPLLRGQMDILLNLIKAA